MKKNGVRRRNMGSRFYYIQDTSLPGSCYDSQLSFPQEPLLGQFINLQRITGITQPRRISGETSRNIEI